MRVVTLPRSRIDPSQSSDARPDARDLSVGGMMEGGRKMVTMMEQKTTTGS